MFINDCSHTDNCDIVTACNWEIVPIYTKRQPHAALCGKTCTQAIVIDTK